VDVDVDVRRTGLQLRPRAALPRLVRARPFLRHTFGSEASACKGRCACTVVLQKSFGAGVVQASEGVHAIAPVEIASSPTPATVFLAQAFVRLETPQLRAIPPPHRLPDPPGIEHASLRAPPATA